MQQMKKELDELKAWKKSLEMSHSIPLNIFQAFKERFAGSGLVLLQVPNGGTGSSNLTGIIKGNGTSPFTAIVPISGTYYVALSPGGSPTAAVTFTSGVLTSEA